MTQATVADIITVVEQAYPPELAESWDTGIGLTCGDRLQPVRRIVFAVDADTATVIEARDYNADMLITHHPLLFRSVQSIATDTLKGRLLTDLVRHNIAHFAAHTNADRAPNGVNDALAAALGLGDTTPLTPAAARSLDKIVAFVPHAQAAELVSALAAAGAGAIGDYEEAAFTSTGTGQFRPLPGAQPAIGAIGALEKVPETRVEMVLPRSARTAVVAALRQAHPYEEPAFDVIALEPTAPSTAGLGRVGILPTAMSLADFTTHVAASLPATAAGVRAAGDAAQSISRVAVVGGSGGGQLAAAVAAQADVLVTADLSHHIVQEHIAHFPQVAVVEVSHWAGEWPWLQRVANHIGATFSNLSLKVSTRRTDPWALHAASGTDGNARSDD